MILVMDNINNFMRQHPKYRGLVKPLHAAKICEAARSAADGRFEVISYRDGLLTLGVSSSSAAADIQAESTQIMAEINQKLDQELVKRLRTKII